MTYRIFSEAYDVSIRSFERYFRFVLNENLIRTKLNEKYKDEPIVLFVFKDEKEDVRLLKMTNNFSNIQSVLMGFDNDCTINFGNLDKLNESLSRTIANSKQMNEPLLNQKELNDKAKIFFTDHGEESLLEKLNWVRYYFLNGPKLLFQNELSDEDYKSKFYTVGISYWIKFKDRLERYSIFLKMLGKEKDIEFIKKLILTIDPEINELGNTNYIRRNYSYKKTEIIINIFIQIDEILSKIHSDLNIEITPK